MILTLTANPAVDRTLIVSGFQTGAIMKAAVFHGPGDLRLSELPTPVPAAGELLVRIGACAICGSDVRTFRHGARNIDRPVVLGHELSGTIVEVGASVAPFRAGQRVAVAPVIPCDDCRSCRAGIETMCERLRSMKVVVRP